MIYSSESFCIQIVELFGTIFFKTVIFIQFLKQYVLQDFIDSNYITYFIVNSRAIHFFHDSRTQFLHCIHT